MKRLIRPASWDEAVVVPEPALQVQDDPEDFER